MRQQCQHVRQTRSEGYTQAKNCPKQLANPAKRLTKTVTSKPRKNQTMASEPPHPCSSPRLSVSDNRIPHSINHRQPLAAAPHSRPNVRPSVSLPSVIQLSSGRNENRPPNLRIGRKVTYLLIKEPQFKHCRWGAYRTPIQKSDFEGVALLNLELMFAQCTSGERVWDRSLLLLLSKPLGTCLRDVM